MKEAVASNFGNYQLRIKSYELRDGEGLYRLVAPSEPANVARTAI
jgi:hypothetical protein